MRPDIVGAGLPRVERRQPWRRKSFVMRVVCRLGGGQKADGEQSEKDWMLANYYRYRVEMP